MNNDLEDMNPGKGMAQAAHAASMFVVDHKRYKYCKDWLGDRGFGTKVVLSANKKIINSIMMKAKRRGIPHGKVVDPTYPMIKGTRIVSIVKVKKMTCAYVFCENEHEILEGLDLQA